MKSKKPKIIPTIIIIIGVITLISFLITIMEGKISRGKLAIVNVKGIILEAKPLIEEIKQYRKDPFVKAIVLRIDSPGGAVVPSQEIYEEIKRTINVKPVVVSMGSLATSGAYYISCAATKIVANPGTVTGSIGVLVEIPNIEELLDKIGIRTEVIKSGRYKNITSPLKPLEKDEKEILQKLINEIHEQFIKAVAEGRKILIEDVKKIADGRVFTGLKAKELKLVDEVGDFDYAIKLATQLGKIKGEPEIVMKKTNLLIDLLKGDTSSFLRKILPYLKIYYLYFPN